MENNNQLFCFDVDYDNAIENKHSAIYLTWRKFYPGKIIPTTVKYISLYDSWNHNNNENIVNFYVGLENVVGDPTNGYKNDLWRLLFHNDFNRESNLIHEGEVIRKYIENQNKIFCNEGAIEIEILGHKGIALNTPYRGSHNLRSINKNKFDFSMVFVNLGDIWRYSVYQENPNFDSSEIAKKIDGGGHTGAAGFQTKELIEEIKNGKKFLKKD